MDKTTKQNQHYWDGDTRLPQTHHKGILGELLCYMREDIIGELQAINDYNRHMVRAAEANYNDIARLWHHIMMEEKEHFAELTEMLTRYDPEQRRMFRNVGMSIYSTQDKK